VQFAIDRATLAHALGSPPADGATLKIGAALVSPTGYWSNQTLPGLGGGQNNLAAPPPGGCPGSFIDLGNATTAPGNQFLSYVLRNNTPGNLYNSPSTFTGAGIPTAMGTPFATQNNYTQFGNATLVNPGNPNCTQIALNNNNIQGVTASSGANASTSTTGMEFDIDFTDIGLADLTNPAGPFPTIRLMAVPRVAAVTFPFLPPLGVSSAKQGDYSDN
jgi:hypothetical protein